MENFMNPAQLENNFYMLGFLYDLCRYKGYERYINAVQRNNLPHFANELCVQLSKTQNVLIFEDLLEETLYRKILRK